MRFALGAAIALAVLTAATREPAAAAEPRGHALLVGCTKYDHPPFAEKSLKGPANDVLLMHRLLRDKFQFAEVDMLILSESAAAKRGMNFRPTRANIERELKALAAKAQKGDRVVVFLSGHGARQPDSKPGDPDPTRYQPDGLEEVFAPCDVQPRVNDRLPNAIADHELRDWLRAIRAKGVLLWLVIDSCHSGGLGREEFVPRGLSAEKLFPPDVLDAAAKRAQERKPKVAARGPTHQLGKLPEEPDLVALYACQATEKCHERSRVEVGLDDPENKAAGDLTWALCTILTLAEGPLSYEDLLRRIRDYYLATGWTWPTPLVEGKDRANTVLGVEQFRRDRYHRLKVEEGVWTVDAGSLHGLTPGSVLAVLPPAGQRDADKPIGYVEVLEKGFGVTESQVRACEYHGLRLLEKLPEVKGRAIARCELVAVNYGDLRLRVAVDTRTNKNEEIPADQLKALTDTVDELAKAKGALIRRVDVPDAQWLLRLDSLGSGKLYLVPVGGGNQLTDPNKPTAAPSLYGPVPEGRERMPWLTERLTRIARVHGLLKVTAKTQGEKVHPDADVRFRVDTFRPRFKNDVGQKVVPGDDGISLYDGDPIDLYVVNEGKEAIDITVLYLSADYGIVSLFPNETPGINRLAPGRKHKVTLAMSADPTGWERIVVIAVKEKAVTLADFSHLAQDNLEKAKGIAGRDARINKEFILKSPLGQLFQSAVFGEGVAGRGDVTEREYGFSVITWKVLPGKRPKDEKK
jgi:hypothetical protein